MKKLFKILGILVLLLVGGFLILLFFFSPYSADQQKVIDAFGNPDYFEITFNIEDEPMIETWKYVEIGKTFLFVNKEFVESIDFDFPEIENSSALLNAPLKPSDLYYLKDVNSIQQKLDIVPEVSDLNPELMENAKLYNFGNLVQVGVLENKPVWVKTFTYRIPAENEPSDETGEVVSEENGTTETYMNETFGFSLEIPDDWKDNYEIQEDYDMDLGKFLITFKYLVASPYEDGVQGYIDVFTIEAYFEEPPEEEVMFSEFLGNNNVYFLYYSHFNGDIAEKAHPIWEFQDIIESIEIFPAAVG